MNFPLKLILLFLMLGFLPEVFCEYISKFGKETLSRCNLIVKGNPLKTIHLPQGGKMVSFKINAIYYGKAKVSESIYIVFLDLPAFSGEEEWVFFLKTLPSGQMYESIGDFSVKDKESPQKILALEKMVLVESIPETQKKERYKEFCLEGMRADNAWTRFHWLREWRHLISGSPDVLEAEIFQRLQEIYESVVDSDLREEIKKNLLRIKKNKPEEGKKTSASLFWEKIQNAQKKLQESSSLEEKIQAVQLFGSFPCSVSQDALILALQDGFPQVQALAVFYLGNHRNPQSIPEILKILKSEKKIRVKKNAIRALVQLHARDAIPWIQEYIKNPYTKDIAQRAMQALSLKK